MIVGVGVDLLRRDRLASALLLDDSAFVRKTYTAAERVEAASQPVPADYFISRFCAKEAVFKALGADPQHARLSDIEILRSSCGQLIVTLHGELGRQASERGIARVHLSLTYETDHVLSFAVAEGRPAPTTPIDLEGRRRCPPASSRP